jgi:uncharacterized membrane protein YphA (DoxX/SURF4 family)
MIMNTKRPLAVAGIIFLIVAVVHLIRYFTQFDMVIAGYNVPLTVSLVAGVILLILSGWMFLARR